MRKRISLQIILLEPGLLDGYGFLPKLEVEKNDKLGAHLVLVLTRLHRQVKTTLEKSELRK